jgi:hypothetical protein
LYTNQFNTLVEVITKVTATPRPKEVLISFDTARNEHIPR